MRLRQPDGLLRGFRRLKENPREGAFALDVWKNTMESVTKRICIYLRPFR